MSVDCEPHKASHTPGALAPDREAIASFLEGVGQGLHLCSLVPDGGCKGRWFGDDITSAINWAASENSQGKNLYWTVNLVVDGHDKKAKKTDIVAVRFAHVDIDPPKGGGAFDKVKIEVGLVALPFPPSLIIDSGGGLQAFWRLAGPAEPSDIEAVNRGLAEHLGGDNCHNIDRLMRLPGTVNYPNAKKRSAGRTNSLAKVSYDPDRLFH